MNAYRDVDDIVITQEAQQLNLRGSIILLKKQKEYVRRESEKAGRPLPLLP